MELRNVLTSKMAALFGGLRKMLPVKLVVTVHTCTSNSWEGDTGELRQV